MDTLARMVMTLQSWVSGDIFNISCYYQYYHRHHYQDTIRGLISQCIMMTVTTNQPVCWRFFFIMFENTATCIYSLFFVLFYIKLAYSKPLSDICYSRLFEVYTTIFDIKTEKNASKISVNGQIL